MGIKVNAGSGGAPAQKPQASTAPVIKAVKEVMSPKPVAAPKSAPKSSGLI